MLMKFVDVIVVQLDSQEFGSFDGQLDSREFSYD